MIILELEIENIRGIKNSIHLKPNGENVVICGPNGTGKSGVVDAIDFLFTGDISRLTGRGTQGMSMRSHGAHIDAAPKDAVVKAKIQIDGISDSITLERRMSKPKDLICSEAENDIVNNTLKIAEKGQHVLSRGEILKYIAAEAGKRAEQIQTILNLTLIENIRKTFVSIERDFSRSLQTNEANYNSTISSISTELKLDDFSEQAVLDKVNDCRKILKGPKLKRLNPEKLHAAISPLTTVSSNQVDQKQLKRHLAAADQIISVKGEVTYTAETELRQQVKSLKDDEALRKELANKRLLELGISLMDDAGACPLCLTPWEAGKLEPFLQRRLSNAKEAEKTERSIRGKAAKIDNEVSKLNAQVKQISSLAEKLQLADIIKELDGWSQKLEDWSNNLRKDIEDYSVEEPVEGVKDFFRPSKWAEHKVELTQVAASRGELTPEQEAWDTLTALKPMLKRYYDEKDTYEKSKIAADRASIVAKTYIETKDRVLEELYKSVRDDFVTYYKELHGSDEAGFFADLKPEGAQLGFTVDFYGRGPNHPRALHSEGHQDSMGLCLYLALSKKISEGKIKLVTLDDVVMSIDSGHRRNVCRLLNEYFPDNQFFITTHNRTWARQLRTDGVINKKNMFEFKGWSVDTGPKFTRNEGAWDEINKKLDDNEIASAAHMLREHAEFFYEQVCDSLQAEVPYKGDGRWDLGAFLKGAKKTYSEYLKKAKKAASSWNNQDDLEKYTEIQTLFAEAVQRSQTEQWGINENVHYSKWADFEKDDFLPIVEAFQDLEDLFICPTCKGVLTLNTKGITPSNVKCPCGNINWNLEPKK